MERASLHITVRGYGWLGVCGREELGEWVCHIPHSVARKAESRVAYSWWWQELGLGPRVWWVLDGCVQFMAASVS